MLASWRWLTHQSADGATHMAIDRAIADHAGRTGRPTFRIYRWSPPCISLGFHQQSDILDLRHCEEEGIDVVRRPTGGRAVFHYEEWTYAAVFPRDWPGTESAEAVYRMIGEGLVRGLNRLGIPARMEKRPLDLHIHYRSELASSCFSAAAKHEVIAEGRKLVGSAQRRLADGILQHGSILTGDAHARLPFFFKELENREKERMSDVIGEKAVCVRSLIGRIPAFEEGAEAIREGVEEALGIRFEAGELSDSERSRVSGLRPAFSILENKIVL